MREILRKFHSDARGNIAMITAFTAVPLMLAVGMAIDYSLFLRNKSALQQSTDAAVLAIAKEGPLLDAKRSQEIATAFMKAGVPEGYKSLEVTREGNKVQVAATALAGGQFSDMFGWSPPLLEAKSTAEFAMMSYEIGLVLDTTNSMAGGKLQAMQNAVKEMVDAISSQIMQKEQLKIALVPFATFVNVGPQFGPSFDPKGKQKPGTGAEWLDLSGDSPVPQVELTTGASRFQVFENLGQSWPGCVEARYDDTEDYDIDDTTPDPAVAETRFVPAFAIDEPDTGFKNSYIKSNAKPKVKTSQEQKKRWAKYGVQTDASGQPLNGGAPAGGGKVKIDTSLSDGVPKGPGRDCTTQPITPLTTDMSVVKDRLDDLTVGGQANLAEGVAWGTRVLSPSEPFTEAAPPTKKHVRRIMIVLTNHANAFGTEPNELESRYNGYGYMADDRLGIGNASETQANSAMNERTLKACEAAKNQGFEIYTIRLEEPHVPTGDMLEDCATDKAHYFNVPSRAQLDEAFRDIKDRIVNVRLSL